MSTTPPNEPWNPGGYPPPPPGGGYPPPPPPPPGGYPGGGYPPPYPGSGYPPPYEGGQQAGMLSGWWRRVGATIIDGLIFGIPTGFILGVLGVTGYATSAISQVVFFFYLVAMLGRPAGQTIGNKAVNTMVVDADTQGPIGSSRAAIRSIVGVVLNLTVIGGILDWLWPLWDARNQTLHDKAANSLVVYRG